MTPPLAGIKILDLSQVWAMPGAAMYLAEQGADVIKVEPFWGDESRYLSTTPYLKENTPGFLVVNRNKRGIALDITTERGREIVYRILKTSDVLLLNYRPGVAERLGYGYEVVRKSNPRLIYVSATPYGEAGEWSQRRGYDMLFQGLSGQLGRFTTPDGTPMAGAVWTVDTAGTMGLAYGIALDLYQRERTGEGQRVDATMLGMSLALHSVGMVKAFDDKSTERPVRPMTHTIFKCADGKYLVALFVREADWAQFCRVLQVEHLGTAENYRRTRVDVPFQHDVAQVLAGVFETRDREAWLAALIKEDLPVAPVLRPDEAIEHPHLLANDMFVEVDHPVAGKLRMFRTPIRLNGEVPQVLRPAPVLGQHTDEVLAELGYSASDIEALRSAQVVK